MLTDPVADCQTTSFHEFYHARQPLKSGDWKESRAAPSQVPLAKVSANDGRAESVQGQRRLENATCIRILPVCRSEAEGSH